MTIEVVAALIIAALVLWLVFGPPGRTDPALTVPEPEAAEETRRGVALLALREIEFDRETGKLSDDDYRLLKDRYSAEALQAIAAEEAVPPPLPAPPLSQAPTAFCSECGPRPEADAVFCSHCGRRVPVEWELAASSQ